MDIPSDLKVIAYRGNNYTGSTKTFTGRINCLVSYGWNDKINSVKIVEDSKDIEIYNDYAVRDDSQVEKLSNEEVLLNASNKEGKFFAVKKVIEED